jgi:hypothetical protein
MKLSGISLVIAFFWASLCCTATAQVSIQLHHSLKSIDPNIQLDQGKGFVPFSSSTIQINAAKGDNISITILDANPYLYKYSLTETKSAEDLELPDLGKIAKFINSSLPSPAATTQSDSMLNRALAYQSSPVKLLIDNVNKKLLSAQIALEKLPQKLRKPIQDSLKDLSQVIDSLETLDSQESASKDLSNKYRQHIKNLAQAIATVDSIAKNSDYEGLAKQQEIIRRLQILPDWSLDTEAVKSNLDDWFKEATNGVTDPDQLIVDSSLKSDGETLLSLVKSFDNDFMKASPRFPLTLTAGDSLSDVKVFAVRKTPIFYEPRDVDLILEFSIKPKHLHHLVELVPIGYLAAATDVAHFSIQDSVVKDNRGYADEFRVGAAVNLNLLDFNDAGTMTWGAGVGLGLGVKSLDQGFTDFFIYTSVNVLNFVRIGLGYGRAIFPDALKAPAFENKPLPPDAGPLKDLIVSASKAGFFIIFSIPGLSLPVIN